MISTRPLRSTFVAVALFAAPFVQPAQATIYDVTMGGSMTEIRSASFSNLPFQVGAHMQSGHFFSASFTLDVSGSTINSVSGFASFDGAKAALTSIGSNSSGSGFRGFFQSFDGLADRSDIAGDVSIDGFEIGDAASSGQSFAMAAVAPMPAGLLLVLAGLAGLCVLVRNGSAARRSAGSIQESITAVELRMAAHGRTQTAA